MQPSALRRPLRARVGEGGLLRLHLLHRVLLNGMSRQSGPTAHTIGSWPAPVAPIPQSVGLLVLPEMLNRCFGTTAVSPMKGTHPAVQCVGVYQCA